MPDEVVDGPKDLLVELGDDGVFPPGLLEEDAEGVPEEQEEPPDPNLLCEGENQTRTWKRQYLARVDGITMKSLVCFWSYSHQRVRGMSSKLSRKCCPNSSFISVP